MLLEVTIETWRHVLWTAMFGLAALCFVLWLLMEYSLSPSQRHKPWNWTDRLGTFLLCTAATVLAFIICDAVALILYAIWN